MKEITLQVPDGKRAEWINGILTLVDEPKVDNRPVTERIKTFEDAREALGDEHPLVKEYWGVVNVDLDITQDLIAYLKLRIITAALNEGWEPKFTLGENRWYPWYIQCTEEALSKMSDEWKNGHCLRSMENHRGYCAGLAFSESYNAHSATGAGFGSRICFKIRELADYAGKQFIDLWMDFLLIRK